MISATVDLSLEPGAMQHQAERTLPDGSLLEFESAPAGWLCKDGTPRARDWRRYYVSPPGETRRVQLTSVTTICDLIVPKKGLPIWAEAQGIIGAVEALRMSLWDSKRDPDEVVRVVRSNQLGQDAKRDQAATRGLNIHSILEAYMRFGIVPNPADHPEPHRPFIQGLYRWLALNDPEPVAVEVLTADPDRGYAGRIDLIARIGKQLTLLDLKTQPKGAIHETAHMQVELYRQAEEKLGTFTERFDAGRIVVVSQDGTFREMELLADPAVTDHALEYWRHMRRLAAACEQGNRIQRDALAGSVAA